MSKTIKIPKSKNMLFKKLSFLYLVFILFLFLTSPGEHVFHFTAMLETQQELNERLISKLEFAKRFRPDEATTVRNTKNFVGSIDEVSKEYEEFADKFNIQGFSLKESGFSDKRIRGGELGSTIDATLKEYIDNAPENIQANLRSTLLRVKDDYGLTKNTEEFFFQETPNGVIQPILEHFKTVVLYQSVEYLDTSQVEEETVQLVSLDEANFITKMKGRLILGEPLRVGINTRDVTLTPTAVINGEDVPLEQIDTIRYKLTYLPKRAGRYSIEVLLGEEKMLTSFRVDAPALRFLTDKSSTYQVVVGEPKKLTFDESYMPWGKDVEFVSNSANVSRTGDVLTVTPYNEGKFSVELKQGARTIDKAVFFAKEPNKIEAKITDASGNEAEMQDAARIESTNPFWEVLSYSATIVYPNGSTESYSSRSKYLKNNMRDAMKGAPQATALVFDDIELISAKGDYTSKALPIVMIK